MKWILIVVWSVAGAGKEPAQAVAMQEFLNPDACQAAQREIQKLAPNARMICVQKGMPRGG